LLIAYKNIFAFFFRTVLDSYIRKIPKDKPNSQQQDDEEIISLDSDDDDNIPLKSDDITTWYSNFLKCLERQYPDAFDHVVKSVMTGMPGRRRNALRNVLG
jgi:U3 small nucleolar RNA-associated protein 10